MPPSGKRRRVAALVTAAATTLTVLTVARPAPAQTVGELRFGENYRQGTDTADSRGRDVPGLAVSPTDPKHVVSVDVDYINGECSFKASFDGGLTWPHAGNFNAPAGWPDPPCFQNFDSGGYAHGNASVVFGGETPTGRLVYTAFSSHRGPFQRPESGIVAGVGDDSLVARSTDGGKTWGTAVPAILGDPNEGGQPFNIRPQVAVHRGQGSGGADRVYVAAWRCRVISSGCSGGNDIREMWVSRSDDSGQTWSAPVRATAPTGGTTAGGAPSTGQVNEPSQPVVDPRNGYVYIAYHRRDTQPTASSVQIARSKDLGQTWERFDASTTVGSAHPRIAINPATGTLYVVYQDNKFGTPTTDQDIVFQRSLDTGSGAGSTWSAPLRVNDDPLNTNAAQQVPRVEVAPDGRIDVVWMDRRHDPTSPTSRGRADIFYAHSLDSGLTFSANRRVTDRLMNRDVGLTGVGGYTWYGPVLAPMGNDEVLFAWTDSREGNYNNGTQDIYLSKLNVRSTAVPVKRLQASRSSLSVTLSKTAYPGGLEAVGATPLPVTKPVIVSETDPVLALAAAPLARAYWGPLLASPAARLTVEQTAEVARLEPVGAYMVGDDTALGAGVAAALTQAGVPAAEVRRISGATPAETARDIALVMDQRTAAQKTGNVAAFSAAVIVNPAGKEAAAAAALATSLGVPILFVDLNSIPAATSVALSSLNITSTIVVAGPSAVTDGVVASLPGGKRVSGNDAPTLSVAAAVEARSRRRPTNIAYVVDAEQRVEAAMVAAAVGRTGGISILTAGADPAVAEAGLANVGMRGTTDRLVVARTVEVSGAGYRLVARDGGVFAFGGAPFYGSTGGIRLAQPVVGMSTSPTNAGYWLVAGDGGVFAFGDSKFFGSTGAIRLAQPVVGMASTPSGKGYWLVARDGGVFAFGDAKFHGSTGSLRLSQPVVGMAPTPSGEGYWLVAADGGVFAFGDARYRGSTGNLRLNQPVVGIASTPSGFGYWMVARDGGVFAFGDAAFHGSTGALRLAQPVVGIEATDSGRGYWFTAADGGVFAFGDAPFMGSTGGTRLAQPMVGMSAGRT